MNHPCEHLKNYKTCEGFTSYTVLHAFYVACIAKGSSRRKTQEVECGTCHRLASRIHACLHCVHFGCFYRRHIHEHAYKENHCLAMDILSGNLFCFKCKDYRYDEKFNAISKEQKQQAGVITGIPVYVPWEPSKTEIKLLKENDFKKLKEDSNIGLRGLFNLGSTCYINCIIQVLVHTPLLRDYFLSDKHKCINGKETCMACIMSDILQEFYSGRSIPLSLETLLYVTWKNVPTLRSYGMHDAQEFFSTILEVLHGCCQSKEEKLVSNKNHCSCVIHQIFSGFEQSDILCLDCKISSSKQNSFGDIKLDFGEEVEDTEYFLKNFLERYTRTEPLGSQCGGCSSQRRTIRTTVKKLPAVICFHFKRLQHQDSPKIKTQVFFPEYLDMSPYLSPESDVMKNAGSCDFDSGKNIFTLFAVVCHSGKKTLGHFFSYIRQHKDSWYICDDITIEKVDVGEVLSSEGYLLFYHTKILEYEYKKPESVKIFNSDQEFFE